MCHKNHRKYNKVSTFRFTTKIPQPPTWGEGVTLGILRNFIWWFEINV